MTYRSVPTVIPSQHQRIMSNTNQQQSISGGYNSSRHSPGSTQFSAAGSGAVKIHTNPTVSINTTNVQQSGQFQRLKVEDALSYLDQVKYKFGNQPQVYNEFLDIMKEFKSQCIDTPGVIERVSNLFKGYPELIVGFNTFLPPGYKIEVQSNEQGYALQVSVSVPSTQSCTTLPMSLSNCKSMQIVQGSVNTTHTFPIQPLAVPQTTMNTNVPSYRENQTQNRESMVVTQGPQHYSNITESSILPSQNQPVEFNHAINYVNKIKNRFQGQPEKYKGFLEILHTYQREQRNIRDGVASSKQLSENEVYLQVARLFENEEDLLSEFAQFLSDTTSNRNRSTSPYSAKKNMSQMKSHSAGNTVNVVDNEKEPSSFEGDKDRRNTDRDSDRDRDRASESREKERNTSSHSKYPIKRSPSFPSHFSDVPLAKRVKPTAQDITLAEAAKFGTLNDFAFFDRVRKALRTSEVYDNFLRCLILYNQEIVSKAELLQIISPFLGKFPDLFRWLKDFLGPISQSECVSAAIANRQDRPHTDHAMEVDLTTCKRLGVSYCALPNSQNDKKCSGRTALCKEVLNDTWVSFPTWSEDSTFVTSRKTSYEEYIYRVEDERFELDVVIETNAATIRVLEGIQKKISRMPPDEAARYRLDDYLGGTSQTIHQRAIRRIYGDKTNDIIAGLKKNPAIAVPVVLRRLKTKEEEWRDAQKGFNKQWREQNEKYYLRSLDYQGVIFKPNDLKSLRSKYMFNEIETLFDERHEHVEDAVTDNVVGPHLTFYYTNKAILDDATNLLIHHVKRQTGIQKQEKSRIKQLLKHYVADLFFHPRQTLSDDEYDDDTEASNSANEHESKDDKDSIPKIKDCGASQKGVDALKVEVKTEPDKDADHDYKPDLASMDQDNECYTLFMANSNWYLFLRYHSVLCERLNKIHEQSQKLILEESFNKQKRRDSTSIALRFKPKQVTPVENYYSTFLDKVKALLDNNIENTAYEESLREMFGIHAYVAFTLDRVVSYAVRQLQHCVTERNAIDCVELFHAESRKNGTGGACITAAMRADAELAYQRKAERSLQDENCFKIYIYKNNCKLTIELIDTESESQQQLADTEMTANWSSYIDCLKTTRKDSSNMNKRYSLSELSSKLIFLKRNYKKNCSMWNKDSKSVDIINSYKMQMNSQNKTKQQVDVTETAELNKTDENAEISSMDVNKSNTNVKQSKRLNELTEQEGFFVSENEECSMRLNNYKMLFILNKDNILYKNMSLGKARRAHKKVTLRMNGKFKNWLSSWVQQNVDEQQITSCSDWLMGLGNEVIPNKTIMVTNNDLTRTPYVVYNKYKVEKLDKHN